MEWARKTNKPVKQHPNFARISSEPYVQSLPHFRHVTYGRDSALPWRRCWYVVYFRFCGWRHVSGADLAGWLGWLVTPPGAAAYFMLLLCVWLKLFRCRPNSQTLKFHSPVSPDRPLNARSLRSLGFPKSPPLKNRRSANVSGHLFTSSVPFYRF